MAASQGGLEDKAGEGLFFKRVSGGWVFRLPISWWPFGLGQERHYLVNEPQKAEILRVMGHGGWRFGAMLGTAVLVGVVPLVALHWNVPVLSGDYELTLLIFGLPAALLAQGVFNVFCWLALRSTLAGVPRTSEPIILVGRLNATSVGIWFVIWIFGPLLFTSIFGLLAYGVLPLKPPNISPLMVIVLTGLVTTYCFAMIKLGLILAQAEGRPGRT
jgi:hypothetical protein